MNSGSVFDQAERFVRLQSFFPAEGFQVNAERAFNDRDGEIAEQLDASFDGSARGEQIIDD